MVPRLPCLPAYRITVGMVLAESGAGKRIDQRVDTVRVGVRVRCVS